MFNTLQREPTRRYGGSEGPCGRRLKPASARLQPLLRTKALAYMDVGEGREPGAVSFSGGLRLAEAGFRLRRDMEYLDRGSLVEAQFFLLLIRQIAKYRRDQ